MVALLDSGLLPLEFLIEPDDFRSTASCRRWSASPVARSPQGAGTTGGFRMKDEAFPPRINHVAISVQASLMDAAGLNRTARLLLRGVRMDRRR